MKAYLKVASHRIGGAAVLGLALLAGCASHPPSPVEDRRIAASKAERPVSAEPEANVYVVQKGDTLSRIAASQKVAVKDLVAWNSLSDPNKVEVGQHLRLVPPSEGAAPGGAPVAEARPVTPAGTVEVRPLNAPPPGTGANTDTFKREPRGGKEPYSEQVLAKVRDEGGEAKPEAKEIKPVPETKPLPAGTKPEAKNDVKPDAKAGSVQKAGPDWSWPAEGKVLKAFDGNGSKGVDIAGKVGDSVLAAGGGKVVYAGAGIRGYGKLVIIKHDSQFLSAYANNSQILVKEGQAVTKGQKIAKVGKVEGGEPLLHFEIRRNGKPTDPIKFLPARE